MEPWQKQHITANLFELVETTKCDDSLFLYLRTKGILGTGDIDILNTKNGLSKTMQLYDIVMTRKNAYMIMIEALRKGNQTGAAAILEKGIPISSSESEPVHLQPQTMDTESNRPQEQDDGRGPAPPPQDEIDFVNNMTPLIVAVRKPRTPMTLADDEYRLPYGFKGYALILNITEFQTSSRNRNGGKLDTQYMRQLWTQLGYTVTTHEGFFSFLNVDHILDEFKTQFTNLPMSTTPVSCVIFIGSHGSFSKIESSDHKEINLYKHVIYKFDSQNCPQLQNRPKIFIIQACQRFQTDSAAPPVDRTKADSILETPIDDAIVCFSTIPGYVANRDVYLGTWYTYCLAKVIMEEAHCLDFLRLLKKTQQLMRRINADAPQGQLSTYLDLGIKTVYFNMEP